MSSKTKSDSIETLQKKADNNDAVAMYQLAEMLAEDTTSDVDIILDYLQRASDSGYKPASYRMYRIQSGKETVSENMVFDYDDYVDQAEKFKISVDHEKAIECLSLVTKSDALKDYEITALDDEYQILIKGKLAWSDEYSTGDFLQINIRKAVALVISIIQNLESHINHHLENINHLKIEEISRKQVATNDYLYTVTKKLLKKLILAYEQDKDLVSSGLIDRVMLMTAKLIFLDDLLWKHHEDKHFQQQREDGRFHAFYDYATRFNPDGNKQYIRKNEESHENDKEDSRMSYIINIDKVNPYDAYIGYQYNPTRSRSPLFEIKIGEHEIESAILKAGSISSLMKSKEINNLKYECMNRYIPSLEFAYKYCYLLMLNHQNKEAQDVYTNVTNTHKKYRKKISKVTAAHVKKFKELVNAKKVINFDAYKHNLYTETLADDPCYIYEYERSNGKFHQEAYEKCNFPKLKNFKHLFPRYKDRTERMVGTMVGTTGSTPEFTISKETLRYIKTLYKGGKFNGLYIEKNISRSIKLSKRAAKYIVISHEYESTGKKIQIKFIRNHIKLQKLQDKSIPDRYYETLVSLGRSTVYKSDHQVLSDILYKRINYLERPRELIRSIKDMTSGMDYYYGTEDDGSLRYQYGYENDKWRIYPVRYDARKKFSAFFLRTIKRLDQSAREEKNPFHAFSCIRLLMLADQWKNNNRDIIRWLASDHFHALEVENGDGVPFQDIEEEADENMQSILYSLRNNEKNIDFSKAIDIDGYATYSDRIDTCISIATDGFVKIPELLFIRALLYLNNLVEHSTSHNSRLGKLTNKFYKRDLQITEVVSQNLVIHDDEDYYDVDDVDRSVTYPFLNSLAKSSAYVDLESNSGIGGKNITKSLQYINDILRKNDEDEMIYACHPSLIQDAIALKVELEKELHGQQMAEVNKKEMELEVQKTKQKAASDKEREMLSFLTHTLRNSLANGPAQLKQSIRLLGTDDYDESNSKYKAINNIVSQLSTFSVVNTLITTFKQYVGDQESFLAQWYEDKQGKADINWVVSFCLRQCISRALFFPNYQRVIKRLIKIDSAAYIKKTRKNYIENILSLNDDDSPTEKISEWMNMYLPKLKVNIDENSPEFAVNNIKYTYLFSIFSEVIWNAFKHTDGEHPINIRWEHNKDHYLFTVENHYIEDEINLESSTNKGLIFIERLLSMFDNASLAYSKDESNTFVASIKLPDNIFS